MRKYIPFASSADDAAETDISLAAVRRRLFSTSPNVEIADNDKGEHPSPRIMKKRSVTHIPTHALSTDAAHELDVFVDTLVGPVGHPNENVSERIGCDKLVAYLHAGAAERKRILIQFLRARHMNATEAAKMLEEALKWRQCIDIDMYLSRNTENLAHPNALFPMHILSTAECCKQPVVYGLIRMLDKRKVERVPFKNATISFFETLYFQENYTLDEMVVILDFRGWSLRRNTPYRVVREGIGLLQDYYPERLGRVFLVNYPTSIRAAYTAISPIIDAGAREKIVWVSDDAATTLRKYIAPKSIPQFMGGELDAKFPDAWPNIAEEWENPDLVASSW